MNPSPNNFSNNVYESNLQTIVTQAYDTYTSVVNSNNVDNSISDQQPMPNNNVNVIVPPIPDQNHHNYQQQYDNVLHHNYQQYIQQPGISNNNDRNHVSNIASNNNTADNNYHVSNNIPYHKNQQSTSNNVPPPQFYRDQNQSNPPQSNILPLLNSFGININSPNATIVIMPTTNSDIQNQLQQILACLNHSS
jgi:hypothetical protein